MPVVEGQGLVNPYTVAGAPVAGTAEVQTLTLGGTPTGGTFRLAVQGLATAAIPWSAVNATLLAAVDAALEALGSVGTGNVATAAGTLTAGIGTITLTFGGGLAGKPIGAATVVENALTGTAPTVAVAVTTPGVAPTARGALKGALLIDTTNGKLYVNTGVQGAPVWTSVGSQT